MTDQPYVQQPCQEHNPKGGRCWFPHGHDGPHDWELPSAADVRGILKPSSAPSADSNRQRCDGCGDYVTPRKANSTCIVAHPCLEKGEQSAAPSADKQTDRYRVWIDLETQAQHWERDPDGQWCHSDDVDVLRDELTRLRAELDELKEKLPCRDGHVWSHQYGDDWTPEHGRKCDCGAKGWGERVREVRHKTPEFDNHHNALACPYCNPQKIDPIAIKANYTALLIDLRALVAARQALRAEEKRQFGDVQIVHEGRCGAETMALLEAVDRIAARLAKEQP